MTQENPTKDYGVFQNTSELLLGIGAEENVHQPSFLIRPKRLLVGARPIAAKWRRAMRRGITFARAV